MEWSPHPARHRARHHEGPEHPCNRGETIMKITAMGIDLVKTVFAVHGVNALRQRPTRTMPSLPKRSRKRSHIPTGRGLRRSDGRQSRRISGHERPGRAGAERIERVEPSHPPCRSAPRAGPGPCSRSIRTRPGSRHGYNRIPRIRTPMTCVGANIRHQGAAHGRRTVGLCP
jgi:hypothetical protein